MKLFTRSQKLGWRVGPTCWPTRWNFARPVTSKSCGLRGVFFRLPEIRSRVFHTSISPVKATFSLLSLFFSPSFFFFFPISGQPLDWGVSHSDAWKWPKGMRQPWSMLHPIGDYRNCPSNNIFIASGWLNATLEILLPSLYTGLTLCNHPPFRVSPCAASARKSTVE